MGLVERRKIEAFKNDRFEGLKKEINAAGGTEFEFEVDWASLSEEGDANTWERDLPNLFFNPIIIAFKNIAIDDMGSDALKSGIKKIVLRNSKKFANESAVTFENGVLTIDHRMSKIEPETLAKIIQPLLEKNL